MSMASDLINFRDHLLGRLKHFNIRVYDLYVYAKKNISKRYIYANIILQLPLDDNQLVFIYEIDNQFEIVQMKYTKQFIQIIVRKKR